MSFFFSVTRSLGLESSLFCPRFGCLFATCMRDGDSILVGVPYFSVERVGFLLFSCPGRGLNCLFRGARSGMFWFGITMD